MRHQAWLLPSRLIREARNPSAHSTKGLVRHRETKEREKRQKEDKGAAGRGSPAWQRAGGAARARDVSPPPPPPPYPDAGSSQPLPKEGPAPGSLCPERDFEAAGGRSSSSLGTIHSGSPSFAEESCWKGSPSEARGVRGQAGGRALGTRKGVPPPPPSPPLSGFPSEDARSFPWPGFLEHFPSGPAATCASGGARGEAGEKRCLRRGRLAKCSQSRCIPSRLRLLPPSLPQLLQAEGETGSGRERESPAPPRRRPLLPTSLLLARALPSHPPSPGSSRLTRTLLLALSKTLADKICGYVAGALACCGRERGAALHEGCFGLVGFLCGAGEKRRHFHPARAAH
ncbi:uncharacterized protein LOC114597214 isoform X2 [Podarcis muralis]